MTGPDPDRTLQRIDAAVDDWERGPDAARWRPEPEPAPTAVGEMWLGPAGADPDAAGWQLLGHIAGEVHTSRDDHESYTRYVHERIQAREHVFTQRWGPAIEQGLRELDLLRGPE